MSCCRRPWIASQILLNEELSTETERIIISKLGKMKAVGLDALMIWSDRPESSQRVVQICRERGVSPYLWYPVLADAPVKFETLPFEVVKILEQGESQILDSQRSGGEEFEFLCPNKVRATGDFLKRFEETLETADFSGIFLDRIRFPSPANGVADILTCFCETCTRESKNVTENFRYEIQGLLNSLAVSDGKDKAMAAISIAIEAASEFLSFRKASVVELVSEYSSLARNRDLDVGIDLFTPALSDFVSQDYSALASHVDWIKPMVYCKTMGPAGLPMELLSLGKIIQRINGKLSEEEILWILEELTCLSLPKSFKSLVDEGIDMKNFGLELVRAISRAKDSKTRIFAGFEAVNFPPICTVDSVDIRRYLELSREMDLGGIVLSWDIRRIPDENIEAVGGFFEH